MIFTLFITIIKILSIVIPLLISVAYFKNKETKILIPDFFKIKKFEVKKLIICVTRLAIIGLAAIVVDTKFYITYGRQFFFLFLFLRFFQIGKR